MLSLIVSDMKGLFKIFVIFCIVVCPANILAQTNALEIDPQIEKMYSPYMYARHGGPEGLAEFKKAQPHQYLKELWYYSKSFYVKKNHNTTGVTLDESIIDISRFESYRNSDNEAIVQLPGYKDVLVLLPQSKLIYKPGK
jgi:hypothetical protein